MDRYIRILGVSGAILFAAAVAWLVTDRWSKQEIAAARRVLDARTAELVQRALTPGSPLACLDAVASAAVEAACEKALFASPETVAAAVTYVDAKLNLLADGVAHAERDASYATELERLRRGLETDRFGIVAQALVSRGCAAESCPMLTLFREPQRVAANLRERAFDANVVLHAAAWPAGAAVAAAPPGTPSAPSAAAPQAPAMGLASVPNTSRFEFPSAASIPPVSIMNAEPPLSKAEEAAIAPPPPPPPAARPPQPARRAASPPRDTTASQPPTQLVPLPQPAPATPGASLR